jgi:hypothetical protein
MKNIRIPLCAGVAALLVAGLGAVTLSPAGAVGPYDPDTHETSVPPPTAEHPTTTSHPATTTTTNPPAPTDANSISANSNGSCTWTVKGTLVVRNPTVDGLVDNDPVAGVQVKVSGRSSIGWYNEWSTVVTNANGDFTVFKSECSNRAVKVEAKFESDELRTTGSSSPSWYNLFETSGTIAPSFVDLNREPFGGGTGDKSTTQARTDAQTWIIYFRTLDYYADIGHPFTGKVVVHNPATLTSGVSAADPILQDIHIDPVDTADLDAWEHELAHVWTYQHGIGEGCLTWDALISGDTHQANESTCVAGLEGVAEYISDKVEQEMNATNRISSTEPLSSTTPFNRAKLFQTFGLVSLPTLGGRDDGWEQVFRMLFTSDVTRQLVGTSTGSPGSASTYGGAACSGQPVGQDDLGDLLAVFNGNDLDYGTMTVSSFIDRVATKLTSFTSTDADRYRQAINPSMTVEPHTLYGC